jgi:hypothetical protein
MKGLLFLSLLILILVSIVYATSASREPFENQYKPFNVPQSLPPRETLTSGDFSAYLPPSFTLLSPPPGGVATVNTVPYQDPAMEKAPLSRIANIYETGVGFLKNEAASMTQISDPSIQLPLTTLRSDMQRLKDEMSVLSRNAGIQSTLTQTDLDDIQANLSYLQKKWRLSAYAIQDIDGFQDLLDTRASLADLTDLLLKIQTEITRLSSSGTTDPVTTNRITTLKSIQVAVQQIVDKVNKNLLAEKDIPILESDYQAFLPGLVNANSPLPQLLKKNNLPPTLASLFPAYQAGDISGAGITQYLFSQYADTFFKGMSWDMQLNYTSERAKEVADAKREFAIASAVGLLTQDQPTGPTGPAVAGPTPLIPASPLGGAAGTAGTVDPIPRFPTDSSSINVTSVASRGALDHNAATGSTAPAKFDWKKRSSEICSAIEKRGYEPGDFGCMKEGVNVSKDFSYRGYARMICTRLTTIYDSSAPEACGCPPSTWPGWKAL